LSEHRESQPSTGNPHTGYDVARAQNGFSVWLLRHSQRKRREAARLNLQSTAPVLEAGPLRAALCRSYGGFLWESRRPRSDGLWPEIAKGFGLVRLGGKAACDDVRRQCGGAGRRCGGQQSPALREATVTDERGTRTRSRASRFYKPSVCWGLGYGNVGLRLLNQLLDARHLRD
jgi:hypothetical protein